VNRNKEVNIVLLNSPHRHDLIPSSCVNMEVAKFNGQIKKIMKINSNVKLLVIDLNRKHFTRRGQHLNLCDKELTSLKLAMIIEQFYKKNQLAPIDIPWKNSSLDEAEGLNTKDETNMSSQPSGYHRNCPAWRSHDFLWT
jgi:hypothetical protein